MIHLQLQKTTKNNPKNLKMIHLQPQKTTQNSLTSNNLKMMHLQLQKKTQNSLTSNNLKMMHLQLQKMTKNSLTSNNLKMMHLQLQKTTFQLFYKYLIYQSEEEEEEEGKPGDKYYNQMKKIGLGGTYANAIRRSIINQQRHFNVDNMQAQAFEEYFLYKEFKEGIQVPLYRPAYQITSEEKKISDIVSVYDIKELVSKFPNWDLQLRQISFKQFQDFTRAAYILLQYQNLLSYYGNTYEGLGDQNSLAQKEKFVKIIKFWVEKSFEKFFLFVVVEKLLTLEDYINQLLEMPLEQQQNKIKRLFTQIITSQNRIFEQWYNYRNLKIYIELYISNIYFRTESQFKNNSDYRTYKVDSKEIPVYSFRIRQTFNKKEENDFKKTITKFNTLAMIISDIYLYLKNKSLDESILNEIPTSIIKEINKISGNIYKFNFNNFLDKYNNVELLNDIKRVTNQKDKFKPFLAEENILGIGTFGKVYKVMKNKALKLQLNDRFMQCSMWFQEIAFHLRIEKNIPLLQLFDMFFQYNKTNKEMPYGCYFTMKFAKSDLYKLIRQKPMSFKQLFPLFRDSIIGLTYMHMNGFAHGDIKPENIFMMTNNEFSLADYGTLTNLTLAKQYLDDHFQVGQFDLVGTPPYMDPIFKRQFNQYMKNKKAVDQKRIIDIFKGDIYSLGLTLFQSVKGQLIKGINDDESKETKCFYILEMLDLPLQIKQIIFQMIRFQQKNRINTFSLFNFLKNFSDRLYREIQINNSINCNENIFKLKRAHDFFIRDVRKRIFQYSKIKNQARTKEGLSYYSGHLKIEYFPKKKDQYKKLQKTKQGTLILLKPNFIPCIFKEIMSYTKSKVNILGQECKVFARDIVLIKAPFYQKCNQKLEYFNQKINLWQICEIIKINQETEEYDISYYQLGEKCYKRLSFNSIKLRPLILTKDLHYKNLIIQENEKVLIKTYNKFINLQQLFEVDFDLSELSILDALKKQEAYQSDGNIFKKRLNINVGKGKNISKLNAMVTQEEDMLISQLVGLNKCNCNEIFGEGSVNLQTLYRICLNECIFKNKERFDVFLLPLERAQSLIKLKLNLVEFTLKSQLTKKLGQVIQVCPLKILFLKIQESRLSNVIIGFETFKSIFQSLGIPHTKLNKIQIKLNPEISNETTQVQLDELEQVFTQFLKMQTELKLFDLVLNLRDCEKGIPPKTFYSFPQFIRDNNVETFRGFRVRIELKHLFGLHDLINETNKALGQNSQYECMVQNDVDLPDDYYNYEGYYIEEREKDE